MATHAQNDRSRMNGNNDLIRSHIATLPVGHEILVLDGARSKSKGS